MSVTLSPLPAGRLDLIAHLTLPAEQHVFSDPPAAAMRAATGRRDGHMILQGGETVGFFAIDPDYPQAHDFAEAGTIGLRMFSVSGQHQGQGIATAACKALRDYLHQHYPDAAAVYLTVNHRNPGARGCYLRGGFEMTGADYLGGGAGPQHIMRLALAPVAAG
ncbi:GNAT family N-acetyltransferase [Anianabacter salinae]|uniref:GNAT family N-acetyltransferase n=1 Tax=Anianabacter salinae TaxID=2851023 RepID=UPI00225E5807|nr:GNAT family N-acetyltransferase [Anianabacter salinae]MBV0912843.1 GNAT family N-acetyltransferase [Anianabacter salinae]